MRSWFKLQYKVDTRSFHECGVLIYQICMVFSIFCSQSMGKYSGFTDIDTFHKKNTQSLKESMTLIHTVYGFFIQTATKH